MELLAYAKLNLSLYILGRRTDGFHKIDSLVQTIDLADLITVERTDGNVKVLNDLGIPPEEDLAAQAARLLLAEKQNPCGLRVQVKKRIPVGSGLGGGSSDAAAVLWAADQLTPPALSVDHLLHLSAQLGSDVPLFLTGGRVRVSGRGERITPLFNWHEESFLIIIPPIHCATTTVYAHFDQVGTTRGDFQTAPLLGENDLEAIALRLYPALNSYRQAVATLNADYFGMSGSGSAFFAAFSEPAVAAATQEHLASSFPEAKLHLCRTTNSGHRVQGRQ